MGQRCTKCHGNTISSFHCCPTNSFRHRMTWIFQVDCVKMNTDDQTLQSSTETTRLASTVDKDHSAWRRYSGRDGAGKDLTMELIQTVESVNCIHPNSGRGSWNMATETCSYFSKLHSWKQHKYSDWYYSVSQTMGPLRYSGTTSPNRQTVHNFQIHDHYLIADQWKVWYGSRTIRAVSIETVSPLQMIAKCKHIKYWMKNIIF